MIINIEDGYRVRVDDMNYTLEKFIPGGNEVVNKKTKEITISKDRWEFVGYYPNIRQALHRVIHEKMDASTETCSLEAYVNTLASMYDKYHSKYL